MRNGLINFAGKAASAAIGIILVPILLTGLGAETYGLWIAALAVAGMVGTASVALGFCVTREVAACASGATSDENSGFVNTAGNVYCLLGFLGGLSTTLLGLSLVPYLHLSDDNRNVATVVFAFVGVSFAADQVLAFAVGVLSGLQRFEIVTAISGASAALRAVAIVALLSSGRGLRSIVALQALITGAAACWALAMVRRLEPRYALRIGRFDWNSVQQRARFYLTSLGNTVASKGIWDSPPLLIGIVLDPAASALYTVGQKFPFTAGVHLWSISEVTFAAASALDSSRSHFTTRELLETGTRWVAVLALPVCLLLWVLAPSVLRSWVGEVRADTLNVMRLITVAVLVDALGSSAQQILWVRGGVGRLLGIQAAMTVTSLALALLLVPKLGIAGAAWAVLLPSAVTSTLYLWLASRSCRASLARLLWVTLSGLLAPCAACMACAFGFSWSGQTQDWLGITLAAVVGASAYFVALYALGAREEERTLVRAVVTMFRPGSKLDR